MNHDNIINIYNKDNIIYNLDSENPDLSALIDIIIKDETLNEVDISCKTSIKDFDIESFQEIIKQSVNEIRQSLKSETERYLEIKSSFQFDKTAIDYFNDIIVD